MRYIIQFIAIALLMIGCSGDTTNIFVSPPEQDADVEDVAEDTAEDTFEVSEDVSAAEDVHDVEYEVTQLSDTSDSDLVEDGLDEPIGEVDDTLNDEVSSDALEDVSPINDVTEDSLLASDTQPEVDVNTDDSSQDTDTIFDVEIDASEDVVEEIFVSDTTLPDTETQDAEHEVEETVCTPGHSECAGNLRLFCEDDGMSIGFASCNLGCELGSCVTGCGDGIIQDGEPCDDGNADESDGCNSLCEIRLCLEDYEYDYTYDVCYTPWQFAAERTNTNGCGEAGYFNIVLERPMNEFRALRTSEVRGGFVSAYDSTGIPASSYLRAVQESGVCENLIRDFMAPYNGTIWYAGEIRYTVTSCEDTTYPGPSAVILRGCGNHDFAIEGRHVMLPIVE